MVKEVTQMERIQAVVRAYPVGKTWVVDCSECGPLGTVYDDDTDTPCAKHMKQFHGATVVTR